ncbi:glycoside hydrolase superfamily [Kockovaella imperatae]|uniref:Glycoside hydrolase superfamily n=1 Tax=Kockovaella imperatae TaxID=4999 RepID=A0A1Y1UNA9_9TREE|nr:glycoside hydrolase superfamily [Kockovaella imperatae]ORX38946.1 glycoside hydrolase superfamily [Kockovaella imperatae]
MMNALTLLTLLLPTVLGWDYTVELTVDRSTKYQVVDGWGCSEAFQRATDVLGRYGLSPQNQSYVLDLLFDVEKGAGFTILRNGIGSSNSSKGNLMNSIEPYAPAGPNATPNYTWDHYSSGQFPLSQDARARGLPYIYADAWSAPGFMKTNDDENNGGYLCGVEGTHCSTGDWKQAYANYLIQFWKYWNDAGVPITHLGFLNEPSFAPDYASMQSNGTQAADFIRVLGKTIQKENIDVEIVCCDDYGWEQQEALMAGLAAPDENGNSGESYLSVISGHGYASPPDFQLSTSLRVWETEWADLTGDYTPYEFWNHSGPGEGLTWASRIQVARL